MMSRLEAQHGRLVLACALLAALTLGAEPGGCASAPPAKDPPRASWRNITRLQTLDPGTVTDRVRPNAKTYWFQIDRNGEKTWGKVSRRSYAYCHIGDHWPDCRKGSK